MRRPVLSFDLRQLFGSVDIGFAYELPARVMKQALVKALTGFVANGVLCIAVVTLIKVSIRSYGSLLGPASV